MVNYENVYTTQYWNVYLLTSNILSIRHNIYIYENMKIVLYLESHRPT